VGNRKYKFDDSFELIGGFWDSETPEQKFTGTLSSKNGRLSLVTAPTYGSLGTDAMRHAWLANINNGEMPKIEGICGFTTEGNCALLGAVMLNEGGLQDYSTNQVVANLNYRISAAVMGLHVKSADDDAVDSAAYYFSTIHRMLPVPWSFVLENEGSKFVAPAKALNVFRFNNLPLGAEVICEVFAGGETKVQKETRIKSVPRVRVIPNKPQSVDWFANIAFRLENFFALCLGTSVSLKRLQLFQGDKAGWLVQKVRGRKEKFNFQMRVRCSSPAVATALDNWLSVPEAERPVERTVLGILRKSSIFVETEFLSLAQALEGFHRIQGGVNKKFSQQVRDSYDMLNPDFAFRLLGSKEGFARKVIQTRNYFTHLGQSPGRDVLQEAGDIFDINQRLHALIRCIMLLKLGISESDLKEPILYQATRWRLH
jgi:hypothetical protein